MIQLNEYLINKTTKEKANFTFDEFVDEIEKHWQGRLYIKKNRLEGIDGFTENIILTTTEHYSSKMSVYIALVYFPNEYGEYLAQTYIEHSPSKDNFHIRVRNTDKFISGKDIDYNICSFIEGKRYKTALFPINTNTLDYIYNILKKYDA